MPALGSQTFYEELGFLIIKVSMKPTKDLKMQKRVLSMEGSGDVPKGMRFP